MQGQQHHGDGRHVCDPDLNRKWDAIVIGAGAAGAVYASELVQAGLNVLMLEMGKHYTDHRAQFVENEGAMWERVWNNSGYQVTGDGFTGAPNLGFGVGGGTLVWTAVALRFFEQDFRMRSHYGCPAGANVEDWPIRLSDLEPFYARAEKQMNVSGELGPWDPPTRTPPPNPPHPLYRSSELLRNGLTSVGLRSAAGSVAIASRAARRQSECLHCGFCRSGCRIDAKYQSDNMLIADALATGRLALITGAVVTRIDMASARRARGVTFVDAATGATHSVSSRVVIAANNPIELPRLFLNSRCAEQPNGIGNAYDNVGRNFFSHPGTISLGLVDECVNTAIGFNMGNLVSLDHCHDRGSNRYIGGFALESLNGAGAGVMAVDPYRDLWGAPLKQAMRRYNHALFTVAFCEGMPVRDNRITVDSSRLDAWGRPTAHIHYQLHANDRAVFADAVATSRQVLAAAGAREIHTTDTPFDAHPAGTMRMGSDPRSSVTDSYGRIHDVRNVFVGGAALYPTGGSVNPTLTLHALALRSSKYVLDHFADVGRDSD